MPDFNSAHTAAEFDDAVGVAKATGTGVLVKTAPGAGVVRTITASNGIALTNGDGVAGAPDLQLTAAVLTSLGVADSAQQPPAEGAFVDGDKIKLDGIEALADVTDTAAVTAAGALMDSEVANLAAVKAFDAADYATAAQGARADKLPSPTGEAAGQVPQTDGADGYGLALLKADALSAYILTDEIKIWDNFRRTASSLGVADSGHTWIDWVGSGFSTDNGVANCASNDALTLSVIERTEITSGKNFSNDADGDVLVWSHINFPAARQAGVIIARDVNNYILGYTTDGRNLALVQVVAGVSSTLGSVFSVDSLDFSLRYDVFRIELSLTRTTASGAYRGRIYCPDLDFGVGAAIDAALFPTAASVAYVGIQANRSNAAHRGFGARNLT